MPNTGWGVGRITDALISPSEAIAFDDASWNVPAIQARFRRAVDAFAPDYVMITDVWNMKPYLAEAMRGYPYYLLSLSRTSVEAMASGIPVVASRIGGLPYTVTDGVTSLLCEPSDPADLASQIGRLLDDPELRRRMGLAGRKRFEDDFVWEDVIERYFRPLLAQRHARAGTC